MPGEVSDLEVSPVEMKELINDIYLTNRAFITDGYDKCLDHISRKWIDLEIHEFDSGEEIWNSWEIPKKWSVDHGYIKSEGERILDFDDHPLHLISYSSSFGGDVSREELVEHIYTYPDIPDAIPYHFRLNYRPWESEWGFCACKEFVDSLGKSEYYVSIDTSFAPGKMKVAEHTIEGRYDETILLCAHLDHTGMANDDLSGVAVGLDIMRQFEKYDGLQYSYKLLIVPEILGTAAYLDRFSDETSKFKYGILLEMLGNDNRPLLQRSFTGDSKIDDISIAALKESFENYEIGGFRQEVGNDELILEGPGFEIPTVSINRFPYPEYHTHLDDISIIHESKLREAGDYILTVIDFLERDFVPVRDFVGVPSLANPKYDLYIDPGQKQIANSVRQGENLKQFSERVFRYLDGDYSTFEIANEFDLPFDFVFNYLKEWEEKGLIETEDEV